MTVSIFSSSICFPVLRGLGSRYWSGILFLISLFKQVVTRGFVMAHRQSKSEKSHRNSSTPCVSMETASPSKISPPYGPGFISLPVKFGGDSRLEVFCGAAVWVRLDRNEDLVVEKKKLFSGTRSSCDPLLTTSQRQCKPTGLTKQLLNVPKNYSCSSSQPHLKTQNAQPTDCYSGSPRFLTVSSHFVPKSWLITRLSRSFYSTKRRDLGYHRFFPFLSCPPISTPESILYQKHVSLGCRFTLCLLFLTL